MDDTTCLWGQSHLKEVNFTIYKIYQMRYIIIIQYALRHFVIQVLNLVLVSTQLSSSPKSSDARKHPFRQRKLRLFPSQHHVFVRQQTIHPESILQIILIVYTLSHNRSQAIPQEVKDLYLQIT